MLTDFSKKLAFVSGLLWLAILAVLFYGDRVQTSVEFFSLEDQTVSSYTERMIFEFNRSVDTVEMEKTFFIDPAVDLELSWVGKKMVASFKEPLKEETSYTVRLGDYSAHFSTREKQLFYIDSSGENRQIWSYALTSASSEAMTPVDLLVVDYQITADGNTVVFFATPKNQITTEEDYSVFPNLYTLDLESLELRQLTEEVEDALNMYFKVSPDGQTILLNRLNLGEDGAPEGTELLVSERGKKFTSFWKQDLSGVTHEAIDFTADSRFIVAQDWNRFKIFPIEEGAYAEQDLGAYAKLLGFSSSRNRLLFLKWKEENSFALSNELIVFDANGGKEVLLQDLGVITDVEITEDAALVLITLEEIKNSDSGIYLYQAESQNLKRLDENNLFFELNLDLSLDEEWLAFERQLDLSNEGGGEIWIMNIDTGEELRLTVDGRSPQWRP